MKTVLKFTLPTALLMALALGGAPLSLAQSNGDLEGRMSRMEEQMRQLMGQVEQLTFEVRRLQGQHKTGELSQPAPAAPVKRQATAPAPAQEQTADSQGVEQVEGDTEYTQQPVQPVQAVGDDDLPDAPVQKAPGPKILGTLPGNAYQQQQGGNGEFQGQVLVPPGGGEGQVLVPPAKGNGSGSQALVPRVAQDPSNGSGQVLVAPDSGGAGNDTGDGSGLVPEKVESVALGNAASADPEAIYERSYESLLRRQFSDAEVGFRTFLDQHRDHSLAGNAQYWLGETYYVQGDYKQAAQAFLSGYRDFPKSRKAADSLLKLGLSLNRLGQKEQACAAYMQVDTQFPKAAETRKRAQSEIKRAGC